MQVRLPSHRSLPHNREIDAIARQSLVEVRESGKAHALPLPPPPSPLSSSRLLSFLISNEHVRDESRTSQQCEQYEAARASHAAPCGAPNEPMPRAENNRNS